MNKSELIKEIANKGQITRGDAADALTALSLIVLEQLKIDGEIVLPGIGKIYAVDAAEREGRNPKTGEGVTIPASKRIKFKAVKSLSDNVNGVQK